MIQAKKQRAFIFTTCVLSIICMSLFVINGNEHTAPKQSGHDGYYLNNVAPLLITEAYPYSDSITLYSLERGIATFDSQPVPTNAAITRSAATPYAINIIVTREKVPLMYPTKIPLLSTKPSEPLIESLSASINGVALQEFVVITEAAQHYACDIYTVGQNLGRKPNHFSVLGDSVVATTHFLTHFDHASYNLAEYGYLQNAIDYFHGSFGRQSVAVRKGLSSSAVLDPMWANKDVCLPNENMLVCEFRLHNPAILLVILGTNDWTETFEENVKQIVNYSVKNGVIPVLVTKANRVDGYNSPRNQILRRVADEYDLPLWDYDLIADTLPNRGLDTDEVHMLIFPENDYSLTQALKSGYGTYNLSAVFLLDQLWRNVIITGCNE